MFISLKKSQRKRQQLEFLFAKGKTSKIKLSSNNSEKSTEDKFTYNLVSEKKKKLLTFQITVEKVNTTLRAYKIYNKQKIPCFKSNLPSKQVFILEHPISQTLHLHFSIYKKVQQIGTVFIATN